MSNQNFYSYENRQGILPISWEEFFGLCKGLALAVAEYQPDLILGIARAGLYPATLLSHFLRAEFYPIRLTSRHKDEVVYKEPVWLVRPPEIVRDQKILIVDEICSEGRTLRAAKREVESLGAKEIRSAVLYGHSWGAETPDYIGLISDALILNPWDREIVQDGKFVMHPEYAGALAQQGLTPDASYLLGIEAAKLAKG
jgi:hypoxanthine phosphoribosyltransferase